MPGWSPSLVKLAPYCDWELATRMSQTRARPRPPPIAWPFIAAMVGTSMSSTLAKCPYVLYSDFSHGDMKRSVSAVLARLRKSAPAQKEEPFPVMITQRTSGSALICSIAAPKSCSRSGVMELRLSGRFSVMVAARSSGAGQATAGRGHSMGRGTQ